VKGRMYAGVRDKFFKEWKPRKLCIIKVWNWKTIYYSLENAK
jgi:hypothetical protein